MKNYTYIINIKTINIENIENINGKIKCIYIYRGSVELRIPWGY